MAIAGSNASASVVEAERLNTTSPGPAGAFFARAAVRIYACSMPPRMTLSPTPVERRLHARRSARVVCAAVLLGAQLLQSVLAAPSPTAAGADADCVEVLLRRMGWRIEQASIAAPVIARGLPCTRGTLVQAQQAGDLHAVLPAQWNAQQRGDALRALLDDPATQCAYAFELGAATQRAVRKLQDNPRYRFSAVQLGWIGFGWRGAAVQGWSGFKSFGRGYQPSGSNAQALDAFYRGQVRSECGVGRQVAQLATQRELYGDAGFDTVFSAGELSIGTFLTLHDTDSILLGAHAGEFFADGKAVKTAQLGRQAFVGAPGFIAHVFDKAYLDDIHNQAENFVVVDVSDAAAQALARRGGFAYYDARNRQIWELAKELRGPAGGVSSGCCTNATPRCAPAWMRISRPVCRNCLRCWTTRSTRGFRCTCTPRASSRSATTWRACSTVTRARRMPST